jgi:polar amino acid transport system substrate-binding protein
MNIFFIVACLVATPETPYRVGVTHLPPMIAVNQSGSLSGFDYDMFELLVDDPDILWSKQDYEYVVVPNFSSLMNQVATGEVDIALSGISVTHDRLEKMHFSQPYINSGQRIMTPPHDHSSIWTYFSKFMRIEIFYSLVAFIINCFFWGAVVWFVERSFKSANGSRNIENLEHGALAAFDAGTTIGYGRYYPVTRIGQIVIVAAFFCGAIVVGDVISTLTTNSIVSRLEGEIKGPDDLAGKIIAVVDGTTSERVAREYNPSQVLECDDFYKAVVEMRLGNAEAVVADDPIILSYVKTSPMHGHAAGSKFHPEDYGIAFGADTERDIVKKFSIAIARLRESGKLALIENQWFGE